MKIRNYLGAMMGLLNIGHPDIEDFIVYKSSLNTKNKRILAELNEKLSDELIFDDEKDYAAKWLEHILTDNQLTHFNISVGITDAFMNAYKNDEDWNLTSRVDGSVVKTVKAKYLMRLIASNAWRSGDPGVLFLDRIEEGNLVPYLGKLEIVNPCSEVTLLSDEPCCLGSINLSEMIEDGQISEKKLAWVTTMATRFLDDVHGINKTPIQEINEMAKSTRRLGLGVLGWADVLAKLKIPYDSQKALDLAEQVMKTIDTVAWGTSQFLAEQYGAFPAFDPEKVVNIAPHVFSKDKPLPKLRNVAVTSIAPTGTIAILAGVNSGIEPFFALKYTRYITDGIGNQIKDKIVEINPYVLEWIKDIVPEDMQEYITNYILENGRYPDDEPNGISYFLTANEIHWKDHINMQAAFQKYTSNSISKTINMPEETTVEEIEEAYVYAWEKGLKSTALYRNNSKAFQILNK